MKIFLKLCTFLYILLFFIFQAYSQELDTLFPDFTVENLHDLSREEEVILPFIYNGYLYAFSLRQKLPLWRIFIGGDLFNPFTVDKDTLYLYDVYNRLYSIDIDSGTILWKADIQNVIKGKPCVYNDTIIIATQRGTIYVINSETGGIIYEYRGEGEISTGLNIHGNLMIVAYKNGRVVAYDMSTKKVRWEFFSGGIINITPIIRDKYIYFGAWDDTFYVLNVVNGSPFWITYVGENISRDFLVFDREIILFFSKGQILSLSRSTGEIKWVRYFEEIEFNYNYFSGIGKFFVFVPDLIAIDPEDGGTIFNYRERAFYFYKEMLFENMIEGEHRLTDEDRTSLLNEQYFSINNYPLLPPIASGGDLTYFIADNSYLYIYNHKEDFFILKYKLG